ncbi:hypothetical protein BKA62DRAFT_314274 [Auriculariales sp. MPI-PUGE-AT-0066]|nr:hypothetical protein BKA62DRAFT_314274 [Auriculariales sp. MPI-PUGE-AT-0066]
MWLAGTQPEGRGATHPHMAPQRRDAPNRRTRARARVFPNPFGQGPPTPAARDEGAGAETGDHEARGGGGAVVPPRTVNSIGSHAPIRRIRLHETPQGDADLHSDHVPSQSPTPESACLVTSLLRDCPVALPALQQYCNNTDRRALGYASLFIICICSWWVYVACVLAESPPRASVRVYMCAMPAETSPSPNKSHPGQVGIRERKIHVQSGQRHPSVGRGEGEGEGQRDAVAVKKPVRHSGLRRRAAAARCQMKADRRFRAVFSSPSCQRRAQTRQKKSVRGV